jgi:hypothetical protein
MPVILILLSSIGWLANIVIAFQAVNVGDTAQVSAHTSNALVFLWLLFGGLLWQLSRKP